LKRPQRYADFGFRIADRGLAGQPGSAIRNPSHPQSAIRNPKSEIGAIRVALVVAACAIGATAVAETPPVNALPGPVARPLPPSRREAGPRGAATGTTGRGWSATVAVAVVLAGLGAAAVVARRLPARVEVGGGPLRVVGRVGLGPRQSIVLVRAGDRTLIVGLGPQGAPSLLGELAAAPEPPAAGRAAP